MYGILLDKNEKNAYEWRIGCYNAKNFRIALDASEIFSEMEIWMTTVIHEDQKLRETLRSVRVLAVVGMSRDFEKAAGGVPRFLKKRGYRIVPVNPNVKELEGLKAYSNLLDIDAIVIFRPSAEVVSVVKDAVARRDVKVIWMQEDIRDDDAARLAEAHDGMIVVQDRCMAKEYRRLFESRLK